MRFALLFLIPVALSAQTSWGQYTQQGCYSYAATTVSSGLFAAGTRTVTVMSAANFFPNEQITWGAGTANAETGPIITVSGNNITFNFANSHPASEITNGFCPVLYFQSASNLATDPIIWYLPGGGWAHLNTGCTNTGPWRGTNSICYEVYRWTQMGFHVYIIGYTTTSDTGFATLLFPRNLQNEMCSLYRLGNKDTGNTGIYVNGNVNQIVALGDSAGASDALIDMMTPYNYWSTQCEDSANHSWQIVAGYLNSAAGQYTGSVNAYDQTCGTVGGCPVIENMFGAVATPLTGTPATLAAQASPTNHIADWVANGSPPIHIWTGTKDNLIPVVTQQTIVTAIAATSNVPPVVWQEVTNYGHTGDNGTTYNASTNPGPVWPPILTPYATMVADQHTPNCSVGSGGTATPTNCATNPGAVVWPFWANPLGGKSSGSSGGSVASGGSQ